MYVDGVSVLDKWTYVDDAIETLPLQSSGNGPLVSHSVVVVHRDTGGNAHLGVHVIRQ